MATPSPKLTSDLCKPLLTVLTDTSSVSMLDYFIQFMEEEKAIQLVQFWLSVEAFKSTPSPGSREGVPSLAGSAGSVNCNGVSSAGVATVLSTGDKLSEQTDSRLSHMTSTRPDKDDDITASGRDGMVTNEVVADEVSWRGDLTSSQLLCKSVATDAMEIYTTYVALNALSPIGVPPDIRQRIEVNICPEDGVIDRHCFKEAQDFVYHSLETSYYPAFLRSPFLCKYQLEYISSGRLCLLDFLLTDNALFYFMEFMEQEGASSLVQFWLMADNFQRHLSHPHHVPDIDLDTRDAIAIYDRFFSLQASEPLMMGDSVRMDIENKICSEQGPRSDSFEQAQDRAYQTMTQLGSVITAAFFASLMWKPLIGCIVLVLLFGKHVEHQTFYPNFLRSSIYLRFLNELVHMLNASSSHRTDTPAAAEGRPVPEWREDLDDPDTLWKRPHLSMRMGFVDQFGRYTSEVECILKDTATKAGRFAWLVRNRQQEEELTMRIAVNIVSEVMDSVRRGDISNTNTS